MKPSFIDHISLIVRNLSITAEFYSNFLGEPILRNENLIVYKVGNLRLFFRLIQNDVSGSIYNKDGVGVNHVGLGVRTMDELEEFKQHLTKSGIVCSEFKTGKFGNQYIYFDDPDGIRLEIYHREDE
jgi:catechol 2,3-dioxygenase-like lactoylglutathione lyase family enzyme